MKNLKEQVQTAVSTFKSGNLSKAEEETKKLIDENPKIAFLYNLLGLISAEQKKIDLAEKYYEKGLSIDPKFAIIYNNLGLLYYRKKKNDKNIKKAEDLYKKSISIDKKNPEPYSNLGILYNSINKNEESIKFHKQAIKINPKFFFAYHNLANIYVSIGEFDKAKYYLNEAIKINPKLLVAHRLLSRITKYNKDEKHLNELEKLYADSNVKKMNDIKYISFALGKAYEYIKDYRKSFNLYLEGNSLFRKKINFSIEDEKEKFNEIKLTYDKELFNKFDKSGLKENNPIFIVGMPRSGTTLVEQILSSHDNVFGADEVEFIPDLLKDNFKGHNLRIYFSDEKIFSKDDFKKIGQDYIRKMQKISHGHPNSTDKLPNNFLSIGFIKLILPNSKIVHCHRNPKDNILSIFKNHFTGEKINFAYDINEIIGYYNLYHDLMIYWKKILPNFIYDIKYESLISNPNIQIKDLLNFCSLEWSDKCLKFHENKRPIKTASDTQARNKIYNSSINYWKNYEKDLEKYFSNMKIN